MIKEGWQMQLPGSPSGCSVLTFAFEGTMPPIRLSTSSSSCPTGDLRAFIDAYRTSDTFLEAQLRSLQAVRRCTISHAQGDWPPPSTSRQGPIDGMPAAPATTALLQVRSNCSRDLSVTVQVGSLAPILSPGATAARRFLQATFSAKFGGASPDTLYTGAPSPLPGILSAQVSNQTQVPDQALWPSGPGLWPLGNKSRSGNNTSGNLLYSTDQQPPVWSAPAPLTAPSPAPASMQCCCYNNTGNPFANPNAVAGCCCGPPPNCCPVTGGLALCRGKGQYCFVVVVVCSMVMAFVLCVLVLGWWTHRNAMRRRALLDMQRSQGAMGGVYRVEMVPKKAMDQPASMDGHARECPVCWDKFRANREWVLFQCQHGTCVPCYQRLLLLPAGAASCPLCRLPLMEPAPSARPPQSPTL
ncbi:g10023 [Coccomyxa viridis]|uniref:G10023 protein n=1 Tax=Coccomyxa viridis TaxID=1274662 RepID=A0ABP1G4A5_9CHLO